MVEGAFRRVKRPALIDKLRDYRVGEQSARSGIAPYNFSVRWGSRKKEKDKGQKASTPCTPASEGHCGYVRLMQQI